MAESDNHHDKDERDTTLKNGVDLIFKIKSKQESSKESKRATGIAVIKESTDSELPLALRTIGLTKETEDFADLLNDYSRKERANLAKEFKGMAERYHLKWKTPHDYSNIFKQYGYKIDGTDNTENVKASNNVNDATCRIADFYDRNVKISKYDWYLSTFVTNSELSKLETEMENLLQEDKVKSNSKYAYVDMGKFKISGSASDGMKVFRPNEYDVAIPVSIVDAAGNIATRAIGKQDGSSDIPHGWVKVELTGNLDIPHSSRERRVIIEKNNQRWLSTSGLKDTTMKSLIQQAINRMQISSKVPVAEHKTANWYCQTVLRKDSGPANTLNILLGKELRDRMQKEGMKQVTRISVDLVPTLEIPKGKYDYASVSQQTVNGISEVSTDQGSTLKLHKGQASIAKGRPKIKHSTAKETPKEKHYSGIDQASTAKETQKGKPNSGIDQPSTAKETPKGKHNSGKDQASTAKATSKGKYNSGKDQASIPKETPKWKPKSGKDQASAAKETPKEKPKSGKEQASTAKETSKEKYNSGKDQASTAKETPKGKPKSGKDQASAAKETPKVKPNSGKEQASTAKGTPKGKPNSGKDQASSAKGTPKGKPNSGKDQASTAKGTPKGKHNSGKDQASTAKATPKGKPNYGKDQSSTAKEIPKGKPNSGKDQASTAREMASAVAGCNEFGANGAYSDTSPGLSAVAKPCMVNAKSGLDVPSGAGLCQLFHRVSTQDYEGVLLKKLDNKLGPNNCFKAATQIMKTVQTRDCLREPSSELTSLMSSYPIKTATCHLGLHSLAKQDREFWGCSNITPRLADTCQFLNQALENRFLPHNFYCNPYLKAEFPTFDNLTFPDSSDHVNIFSRLSSTGAQNVQKNLEQAFGHQLGLDFKDLCDMGSFGKEAYEHAVDNYENKLKTN